MSRQKSIGFERAPRAKGGDHVNSRAKVDLVIRGIGKKKKNNNRRGEKERSRTQKGPCTGRQKSQGQEHEVVCRTVKGESRRKKKKRIPS